MVYGFVRQSGGHVAIESALGVGTTVSLYLPQAAQMPETEVERTDPNTIPGGTERILIVEDNESLLQVTSEILMELGYKVVTARNGDEAIQLFESGEEFDLMFSDIVMPFGMNGVELGREARRLSKGIKVLLTSGYADDVLDRHGAAEEFPIIGKPFRPIDLAHRLRSILHDA
jgi:CheY-like chemotaxis protein